MLLVDILGEDPLIFAYAYPMTLLLMLFPLEM